MQCAHCSGRLFQDREDTERWACILCGRSPQQPLWQEIAEAQAVADTDPVTGRRRLAMKSGKVRL